MLSIDVTTDVISSALFLLLAIFGVLVFIAFKIGSIGGSGKSERVIEKHYVGSSGGKGKQESEEEFAGETEEERKARIKRDIELEERWAKKNKVDAKLDSVGKKEHVDGASSKKAVDLLRKMNKGEDADK